MEAFFPNNGELNYFKLVFPTTSVWATVFPTEGLYFNSFYLYHDCIRPISRL